MFVICNRSSSVLRGNGKVVNCLNICKSTSSSQRPSITSEEILQNERKVVPGNWETVPLVIVKGEGVYIWDLEGNKYIDFSAGYGTLNQGHCHPKIVQAMREQVGILHHTARTMSHNLLYEASKKLTEIMNFEKVLFTNTGVEGGETAIKLARKWGYRVKNIAENEASIVFVENNYWGQTLAAISASCSPTSYHQFEPLVPGYHKIPYNNLEKLEEKLKDPNVCAFMVEPIQGMAGAVMPDVGYLKGVRELCSKYDVLWIDDEVQTGLGRAGKLLAVDYEQVKPDILILGKALSGGVYPVSAVFADAKILDCFTPGTHGSTFDGNPLACKIATTAVDVILNENLIENSAKMGEIFRTVLSNNLDRKKVPTIRGRGLLNAIVVDPDVLDVREVTSELRRNGLIITHIRDHILRSFPPLNITEEQLRTGLDIIVNTINSMSPKSK